MRQKGKKKGEPDRMKREKKTTTNNINEEEGETGNRRQRGLSTRKQTEISGDL